RQRRPSGRLSLRSKRMSQAMTPPIVERHDDIWVVRDDLYSGGTKARYFARIFEKHREAVYATPAQGGAQTALAVTAAEAGKRATLFVAGRKVLHPRTQDAARRGAKVVQVAPGHLSVVQARARAYAATVGAYLVPFGADMPEAIGAIAEAAK